ncbi:photosystem II reaction center W [Hibiscus trionum]|uniref:PSII 6.1 kDa protein n=1 Tax=Hibiscus trionum TaxID=183268 RepID=A0A9W7LQS3_HIBTR|nr:photosystem II reaction center W [Hibiscus trionum]
MVTISATTFTSSIAPALKTSARITPPVAIGLPTVAKKGKVMCSMEKKGSVEANVSTIATSVSLLATATMSSPPAMALVDERLSTEGTGLPFGLSNNFLGWILFGVFGLIWTLYFVYTSSLDEDEDSRLSL